MQAATVSESKGNRTKGTISVSVDNRLKVASNDLAYGERSRVMATALEVYMRLDPDARSVMLSERRLAAAVEMLSKALGMAALED